MIIELDEIRIAEDTFEMSSLTITKKNTGISNTKVPEPHSCTKRLRPVLSPYMSEATVPFVNDQSQYVKDLCRLTKFWQQGIAYFGFKSGRSFLFECIAIK